jgi:hypothetical protein
MECTTTFPEVRMPHHFAERDRFGTNRSWAAFSGSQCGRFGNPHGTG